MNATVLYLSHGGGPLPLLGDANHRQLVATLQGIAGEINRPEAIVVFSAHWETQQIAITSAANPPLIYDYSGFPPESYQIQYPAAGSPQLAKRLYDLLLEQGLATHLEQTRGFDHGVFVPLKIMYPDANIPVVQISLHASLDPDVHIQLGKALRGLKNENILFVGSGLSFHNLRAFFETGVAQTRELNMAFENWINDTLSDQSLTEVEREMRLVQWQQAPGARFCHPREEHLLPLHVCYGLAGGVATRIYSIELFGKRVSCVLWKDI